MSRTNVELTRQAYEAINRRDVDWLVERADPAIEMHMYGVAGVPVTYRGASGIREYLRDMEALWEAFESVPDDVRDLGDRVIVIATHRFRGRTSGVELEQRAGVEFRLREGVVTKIRAYQSVEDALAAAGLE